MPARPLRRPQDPQAAISDEMIAHLRRAAERIDADLGVLIQEDLDQQTRRIELVMQAPLAFLAARGMPMRGSAPKRAQLAEQVERAVIEHKALCRSGRRQDPAPRIGHSVGLGLVLLMTVQDHDAAAQAAADYLRVPVALMRATLQVGVTLQEDTAFSLAAALCLTR